MAMTINVNGGSKLQVGQGAALEASQQLSTCEVLSEAASTDVKTYGGATSVSGQSKRTLHMVGYQDWNTAQSLCAFLEDNQGKWVPVVYDQYGGGAASPTNPLVLGEMLCVAPKRGGNVDEPEQFDITVGMQNVTIDLGA